MQEDSNVQKWSWDKLRYSLKVKVCVLVRDSYHCCKQVDSMCTHSFSIHETLCAQQTTLMDCNSAVFVLGQWLKDWQKQKSIKNISVWRFDVRLGETVLLYLMIKERKPGAQSVMTLRRYIINNWNVSNRSPDLLSPTWSKREGRVSWKTQYVTLSSDLHSWLYTTEKRALVGVRDNISHTISELSAKGLDVSKEKFSLSDFYLISSKEVTWSKDSASLFTSTLNAISKGSFIHLF